MIFGIDLLFHSLLKKEGKGKEKNNKKKEKKKKKEKNKLVNYQMIPQ